MARACPDGTQRPRHVLGRHRPVVLAHGRTDAGRQACSPTGCSERRPAGRRAAGPGGAVRLARRHRPRPRLGQGRHARPAGQRTRRRWTPTPPTTRWRDAAPAAELVLAGDARVDFYRRRRRHHAPPPEPARAPQRHDLPGLRTRRVGAARDAPTTPSAAASSSTSTRSGVDRIVAGRHPGALPLHHRRRAAGDLRAARGCRSAT